MVNYRREATDDVFYRLKRTMLFDSAMLSHYAKGGLGTNDVCKQSGKGFLETIKSITKNFIVRCPNGNLLI